MNKNNKIKINIIKYNYKRKIRNKYKTVNKQKYNYNKI